MKNTPILSYAHWTALMSATLLTSCAQVSDVSTNVDPENFRQYFAPAKVKIVESEQQLNGKFKLIGVVEGEDCQEKPHLAAPDPIAARTMARAKAFELGANAIIFSGCTSVETKQCVANLICYGKAYQVMTDE